MTTTSMASEVAANPIDFAIELIAAIEPSLPRSTIVEIVTRIAGGRGKQRRLAQALLDRPAVLTDGRSPAPRAIAELLLALRAAGSTRISAPVCAGCPKQLRTLQRRGEDWWCGPCSERREPCSACAQLRPVDFRDRHGEARCTDCPPDQRDPVEAIVEIVAGIDPFLTPEIIAGAVRARQPVNAGSTTKSAGRWRIGRIC